MRNTTDVTGGKPIAVLLQSISGVSAINPLVAFYDIHGGKREVLFFYFVPDTTRGHFKVCLNFFFPFSYSYPTKWGRYNIFLSCCDKDSAFFLRPAACLTSTLLETGVDANDCKYNRDQELNVLSEVRKSSR
jgi:hypothetical protein